MEPGGRRLPRRPRGGRARLGPDHRRRGREVHGRQARRVRRSASKARSCSARRPGSTRTTSTTSTSDGGRPDRGPRHRPRGLLGPVRRAARAHRGLPAARRGAGRGARGRRRERRPRGHRAEGARGRRLVRRRAGRPRAVPRGDVRHVEPGAAGPPGGRRAGRAARPAADADARLRGDDTGEWLANCAACCVPEIAGACTRAGIPYDTVAGTIDDDERAWARIAAWVRAAGAARALRRARIGFLGHTYPGMLDMYTDFDRRPRPGRRARRAAGDRRPGRARGGGHGGRRRRQARRDPRAVHVRRSVRRPDRGPDRGRAARLDGARGRRPRPARRRLRPRRADLLLPRARRQRGRAARRPA